MCNCEDGILGRFEGCVVYCGCRQGLERRMTDAARKLAGMAETLERLDTLDRLGRLDAGMRKHRDNIKDNWRLIAAEHDQAERAWQQAMRVAG